MSSTAITVTVDSRTIDAALACLAAIAADEREPQRYRDWYSSAHEELAAAYKNGSTPTPKDDNND